MLRHQEWKATIERRNNDLTGDWWPFIQNIEDVMQRCRELEQKIDDMQNSIGETQGMIKNLRKILIKLEVIDDRFIF